MAPLDEKVREMAVEILSGCAAHYVNPAFYQPDKPQMSIDMAIANTESILRKHLGPIWTAVEKAIPQVWHPESDELRRALGGKP